MGIDNKFVFPFFTMIFSAIKYSRSNFSLIVGFDPCELSEENRHLISEVLRRLGLDYDFVQVVLPSNYKQTTHIPASSFIRFLLADALDERFLWLDCDLICQPGWDQILELDHPPADTMVFAAVDSIVLNLGSTLNKARLLAKANYFNAGVMVIDANKWNQRDMRVAWRDALAKYEEFHFQFADQCIMNYIARDFWSPLHASYNQLEMISRTSSSTTPKIRHFAGPLKPWHYTSEWSPLRLFSPFSRRALSSYFNVSRELRKFFLAEGWISKALVDSKHLSRPHASKITQIRLALSMRKTQSKVKRYF